MKISIQNEVEPRISQCKTEIHEPRCNGCYASSISNHETYGKNGLNGEESLLVEQGTGVGMEADNSIEKINFWEK